MRETNGKRVITGFINQEQPSNPSFLPRHVIISSGVAPLDFWFSSELQTTAVKIAHQKAGIVNETIQDVAQSW